MMMRGGGLGRPRNLFRRPESIVFRQRGAAPRYPEKKCLQAAGLVLGPDEHQCEAGEYDHHGHGSH